MRYFKQMTHGCVITAATFFIWAGAAAQTVNPLGPPDMHVASLFAHETTAHVGEKLPYGIEVVNNAGNKVDLRAQVQSGPVILIKISNTAACSSCDKILNALRDSKGRSIGEPQARIVILRVNDSDHASMQLPSAVTALHSASKMQKHGFLAGQLTPTAFYFDKNLKLIKRRPGLNSTQSMLHFPVMSP